MTVALVVAALALLQQPAKAPDVTLMKAALGGSCSADFTVKDAGGKPVYAAMVHVKVRYGFAGVKRADLEVGTSSEGKARIEGLPDKARPMTYDVKKDEKKTEVTQDVADMCHATFDVTLR
jgi:hypothetical protein